MPSADFCLRGQDASRRPQFLDRNAAQTSRGKFSRVPCTVAGSTLRLLDGYGLCDSLSARPTLAPPIRFLFINSHFCSALPSDPASRRQPLRIANPSPPSGWVEDFHLQATEHARHTTFPRCGNTPEARRLAKRFEWHYTPKHGSWLDMAESELGVLSSQCLSRRIPDKPTLEKEVPPGRTIATSITQRPTGNSPQTMLA